VADSDDGDNVVLVVDGVPHAVLAAAGAPLTPEWLTQRRCDPVGIAGSSTQLACGAEVTLGTVGGGR